MRRFRRLLVVLVFLSLRGGSIFAAETPPLALFQEALVKESGERDPEAAIDLYRQVIEQPSVGRSLKFKAQLHLAGCYERVGRPLDAEPLYHQILTESPPGDVAQQAQTALTRLEAQAQAAREAARAAHPEAATVLTREFHETRFAFSVGPTFLGAQGNSLKDFSVALRGRLSSPNVAFPLYLEAGAVPALWDSKVQNQSQTPASGATVTESLSLKFQAYSALINELPHGRQRDVIPELGAGVALTDSTLSSGGMTRTLRPYFSTALHVFADRRISFLLQGSYTALPFKESVEVQDQNV